MFLYVVIVRILIDLTSHAFLGFPTALPPIKYYWENGIPWESPITHTVSTVPLSARGVCNFIRLFMRRIHHVKTLPPCGFLLHADDGWPLCA